MGYEWLIIGGIVILIIFVIVIGVIVYLWQKQSQQQIKHKKKPMNKAAVLETVKVVKHSEPITGDNQSNLKNITQDNENKTKETNETTELSTNGDIEDDFNRIKVSEWDATKETVSTISCTGSHEKVPQKPLSVGRSRMNDREITDKNFHSEEDFKDVSNDDKPNASDVKKDDSYEDKPQDKNPLADIEDEEFTLTIS